MPPNDAPRELRQGQAEFDRVREQHAKPAPKPLGLGIDFDAIVRATPPTVVPAQARVDPRHRAEGQRRARELAIARVASMPVPRELILPIVDDAIEPRHALLAVKDWRAVMREGAGRVRPTLVLLSGVRVGKTVASAWLVGRIARSQYFKFPKLCSLARAGFGPDAQKFEDAIRAPFLVVDELTTERDEELGRATLQDVVDERQARDLPTILIANRTRPQLFDRYDQRTVRRLLESATFVECGSPTTEGET